MKIRSFLILSALFSTLFNFAQLRPASDLAGGYNFSVTEAYNFQRLKQSFFEQMAKDLKIDPADLKGSPYLFENFLPGKINDDLTKKSVDVYLRYNVYNDVFEVKYDISSNEIFGFIKKPGYHAQIEQKKFYYKSFKNKKGGVELGYMEELVERNKVGLFKRHFQKLQMPKPAKTSLERDIPGKINNHSSYYLIVDENITILPSNKKKIINSFPKHHKELKEYVSKESLKLKNEEDLIKLVRYYNTII